jgi:hypothetical protein
LPPTFIWMISALEEDEEEEEEDGGGCDMNATQKNK